MDGKASICVCMCAHFVIEATKTEWKMRNREKIGNKEAYLMSKNC